ncbi:MAG: ornithine cyclodeaminase family protein [Bacillati bacterium ANGP1]|uniref:Ornithine cyclodeaminase family protein n=1 Tax=Candidatus Segetimicrobium genomatis TaxID=2569760 RepID=A0A537JKQ0_9BACT|nr:MAG: ornithine cyclodeaminase family protein [Terrabacteria group bacterium ANGP1]
MALLLGESHLRQLLTMRDLVPLMERTLAAFSAGRVLQPVRTAIPVQEHGGFLFLMPAYLRDAGAMGLKAVALYPGNAARGLPALLATILLYDPATGKLLGVLDGRLITEMRTAAVSAAATKHLARRGAKVVAFLGAGVQARSHMEALLEVCRPVEVRVWTRTRAHADAFAREVADRHRVAAAASATAEEAVRGAEIVCTMTSSQTPVLRGRWLSPGAHINAVGAPRPDWRELDTEAVARSRLFVDSRAAATVEAGDIVGPIAEGAITDAHILAEIGEVFEGRHPGRTDPDQITLFKSLGLAAEDVATARFAYERGRERQVGDHLELD